MATSQGCICKRSSQFNCTSTSPPHTFRRRTWTWPGRSSQQQCTCGLHRQRIPTVIITHRIDPALVRHIFMPLERHRMNTTKTGFTNGNLPGMQVSMRYIKLHQGTSILHPYCMYTGKHINAMHTHTHTHKAHVCTPPHQLTGQLHRFSICTHAHTHTNSLVSFIGFPLSCSWGMVSELP